MIRSRSGIRARFRRNEHILWTKCLRSEKTCWNGRKRAVRLSSVAEEIVVILAAVGVCSRQSDTAHGERGTGIRRGDECKEPSARRRWRWSANGCQADRVKPSAATVAVPYPLSERADRNGGGTHIAKVCGRGCGECSAACAPALPVYYFRRRRRSGGAACRCIAPGTCCGGRGCCRGRFNLFYHIDPKSYRFCGNPF